MYLPVNELYKIIFSNKNNEMQTTYALSRDAKK